MRWQLERVVEPTCIEAQEIENTSKDVHAERGILEIVPGEKWAGVLRGLEPSPESLRERLVSKCQPDPTEKISPSSRSRA